METFSFSCPDAQGNSVQYTGILHPWNEGLVVSTRLMAAGLDGLASAVRFKELLEAITQDRAVDLKSLAMQAVEPGQILAGLKNLLLSPDGPKLIGAILRYSTRAGVPLEKAGAVDLSPYRGNYGELWVACYEVIVANRFLSLPGIFGKGG